MSVRTGYDILRSHVLQLEGIIHALNCCFDDPDRRNLCAELVEAAERISKQVGKEVDELSFRNPGVS